MRGNHDLTLRQLADEADRYARFYFEDPERKQLLAGAGQRPDSAYAVVAQNQFVPLDSMKGCAAMLRRFVRGTRLNEAEDDLLRDYLSRLESAQTEVIRMLKSDGGVAAAKAMARERETWPALGLAESGSDLRTLIIEQFERMRRARIAWRGVDSSSYDYAMKGGAYTPVVWFWHGI